MTGSLVVVAVDVDVVVVCLVVCLFACLLVCLVGFFASLLLCSFLFLCCFLLVASFTRFLCQTSSNNPAHHPAICQVGICWRSCGGRPPAKIVGLVLKTSSPKYVTECLWNAPRAELSDFSASNVKGGLGRISAPKWQCIP